MTYHGGILLGTTSLSEMSLTVATKNKITGVTRNPYNPALTAGGSSGAAAIALGIGQIGFGDDDAGSIRIPASVCGVIGVKPSSDLMMHCNNNNTLVLTLTR